MSAKKKRRKIAVNPALAKVGECGPQCKKRQMANKMIMDNDKRQSFSNRLQAPTLVTLDEPGALLPELGEETAIDVNVHGVCHALQFECLLFEKAKVIVVEGNSEATASKQAFVELLSFCEDELQYQSCMMAIPKNRSDLRTTVRNLCQFLDFELIPPAAGWSEDHIYLALDF
ncbi:Oidioi.mRNA.OKI2018_I69.chr2.g7696.t1.cds [Oikopleura dioica]|uniref:Oidioi.mRNA.OKI2018_I69.chr2.g7696.t1.cds n=1 Tax=Oikopleura dioica TaxID=34765 RepID=A0ABN7TFR3_OIKDI|nr:Oidioi.mRNA.OKI2018_I69.chr2.g7696.t1.cds [Oikopleura dioica]